MSYGSKDQYEFVPCPNSASRITLIKTEWCRGGTIYFHFLVATGVHQCLSPKKGNTVSDMAPHLRIYRICFHAEAEANTMTDRRNLWKNMSGTKNLINNKIYFSYSSVYSKPIVKKKKTGAVHG